MCADNVVKFVKIVIPKSEIQKMPKEVKRRYLMLTNMLRDLNLLQKLLLFAQKGEEGNEISQAAHVTTSFFFLKTLISKIHEIWKFIKDDGILNNKDSLPTGVRGELEKVEKFFFDGKREELFDFIRNKFGFHYETRKDVEPLINEAMDNYEKIEMWLSANDSGNDIFSSSNTVIMQVILQKMREFGFKDNDKGLLEQLLMIILKVAALLREFCARYLSDVILNGVQYKQEEQIEISAPLLSQVKLPLIVKADKVS